MMDREWLDFGIPKWLLIFIGILSFLSVIIHRKFSYWTYRGLHNVSFFEVIKMLYDMYYIPIHDMQLEFYKRYGRIFGSYEGFHPTFFVAEPHLLKNILVKDFHVFRNRGSPDMEDLFGKMLQAARDERWKRIRCIMSPTFTSGRMRKMECLVKECVNNFIRHCQTVADKNEELDCKQFYSALMLDIIAATAFGTKLNSLSDPNGEFVKKARSLVSSTSTLSFILFIFFPSIFRIFRINIFSSVTDYFKEVAAHIIDERKKNNIKGNDFLQLMIDAQQGNLEVTAEDQNEIAQTGEDKYTQMLPKHKTLSTEEMLAQCILFLLVGNETTSNTLSFLTYYLANNPHIQDRLIEEIDKSFEQHDELNFDIVNKLPYLDAVVCETLRLNPIGFILMRECGEDYELGDTGITLEKGITIQIPIYAMHMDPEFFPNPKKFDPDRFMPENKQFIPSYAYLPFGDGPRNCIGMRFALMVVKLSVVHALCHLKFVATEETKKPINYAKGQGIMIAKNIPLKIERREKQ